MVGSPLTSGNIYNPPHTPLKQPTPNQACQFCSLLKEVPAFEAKRNPNEPASEGAACLAAAPSHHTHAPTPTLPLAHTAKVNVGGGGGGDLTNLIGVGLIGALNTNGFSNTSALASNLFASGSSAHESPFNKRLLSRYGCYLLAALVAPARPTAHLALLGRLVAMCLQWFHSVCSVPSDASGELIAKLRSQLILPWLKTAGEHHYELVVTALLPHPADFTKVGLLRESESGR